MVSFGIFGSKFLRNVTPLGQTKSDNINRMITITIENGTLKYDHIKWLIKLTSEIIKRFLLYIKVRKLFYKFLLTDFEFGEKDKRKN